jgi:hypothetical protein
MGLFVFCFRESELTFIPLQATTPEKSKKSLIYIKVNAVSLHF